MLSSSFFACWGRKYGASLLSLASITALSALVFKFALAKLQTRKKRDLI